MGAGIFRSKFHNHDTNSLITRQSIMYSCHLLNDIVMIVNHALVKAILSNTLSVFADATRGD